MPSSVTLVAGFIPLYRNFLYHFTSLDYYHRLVGGKERERNSMESARAWNNTRGQDRERERSLCDLSSLVISLWVIAKNLPGQVLVLSSCAIDSTRLDSIFLFRSQITFTTSFLLARKRSTDDIIDNKRRLRVRKIEREIALFAKPALFSHVHHVNVH